VRTSYLPGLEPTDPRPRTKLPFLATIVTPRRSYVVPPSPAGTERRGERVRAKVRHHVGRGAAAQETGKVALDAIGVLEHGAVYGVDFVGEKTITVTLERVRMHTSPVTSSSTPGPIRSKSCMVDLSSTLSM
jgi:hypothetical protein